MKPVAIVSITIDTSRETVFDALVNPELISQWIFGPALREETILHIKTNPVLHGTFSFLVERNSQRINHLGRYLINNPPDQLQFTWAIDEMTPDDSVVTITLETQAGSCKMTLSHELHPDWANYTDRTREAWAKMTGQLKKVLESQRLTE